MMKSYFLCIFVFSSLRNALAINCYTCIPQPPSNWCISNLNVSNCDNVPGAPPGATFDTCAKVSLEISFGGQKLSANTMTCGVKSLCGQLKQQVCNASSAFPPDFGITLSKCEAECCDEDKCNGLEPKGSGSTLAALFSTAFLSLMAVFTGGFIY